MFADDLWNVVLFEKDVFEELLFEYEEFQSFSGLEINYNKTEVMRLGSIRNTDAKFYSQLPLHWSDGPVKVLGINIFSSWEETSANNYKCTLDKVENTLKTWGARSLTPIGKIQIINFITNSYFVYKFQVLMSPSQKDFVEYKKLVVGLIWDGKRSKISYDRLIASFKNGGLQLRDLN